MFGWVAQAEQSDLILVEVERLVLVELAVITNIGRRRRHGSSRPMMMIRSVLNN
jgi:hypothetical protein